MVVSHAIQDGGFSPTRYYSINAAVAREAYTSVGITHDERTRMVERLWKGYWNHDNPSNLPNPPLRHLLAANWHELFPSNDNRSKLTWKNRFSQVKDKVEHFNFFSEGDDVVRDAETDSAGVMETALSGNGFSAFAWAAQEFVKGGTSLATFAMLPKVPKNYTQAGWSLYFNPPISGYFNQVGSGLTVAYVPYSPVQAAGIPISDLKTKPFFGSFLELDLHDELLGTNTIGSNKAAQRKVQYNLLARGIPALSFAAATHSIDGAEGNFDMELTMRTDSDLWPTENRTNRIKSGRWLHSDMRDVAFVHVFKVFQQLANSNY
jgi:hypothetical protein